MNGGDGQRSVTGGRLRWAWFVLGCVALLFALLTTRYTFLDCWEMGCMVGDRWTGSVFFSGEEPVQPSGPIVRAKASENYALEAGMLNMSRRKAWTAVAFVVLLIGCYVWYFAMNLEKNDTRGWFGY